MYVWTDRLTPRLYCVAQLRGSSMRRAIKAVLRREGWRGLYSGVGAVALGAGCRSHLIQFPPCSNTVSAPLSCANPLCSHQIRSS